MWPIAKPLLLGAFLVSLASSILLLSDLDRRTSRSAKVSSGKWAVRSPLLPKKWSIHLLKYVETEDAIDAENGFLQALRDEGLEAGGDYELTQTNAHGDMATLSLMVDAAVTSGADLLVTLSTPTLQAALNRGRELPIVFTLVANPFVAGAGQSDREHLPNVTGVYAMGAYEEVIAALRECLSTAKVVGTLFVPAEVNTVFHKDMVTRAAAEVGLEVIAVPVTTPTEVSDAATALCSRKIDAVCQVAGNLLSSSFVSISHAARRLGLPIFAFLSGQANQGAAVTVARDFGDAGKQAGRLAVRVMRGESPGSIPFEPIRSTRTIINLPAARDVGLYIPPSLLKRADEVLR